MKSGVFLEVAMLPGHKNWDVCTSRFGELYQKEDDIRSAFSRDYNRILHSKAYRRLKHKTQVFYATTNDHICTRIEHVSHVASVSYSIAHFLGLNTELTSAIALGHDLGHAPFGHHGEYILRDLLKKENNEIFWHERNSLNFVDNLETLPNLEGKECNLNLTYAVRDGIISHCGEVNENAIIPRKEAIDLWSISKPNENSPFTWEACVVKIADKISYLGRDIEDALSLGILNKQQLKELAAIAGNIKQVEVHQISNTVLMHDFINNLCEMSHPDEGIRFSPSYLELIDKVKAFNYKHIYLHPRLSYFTRYAELILTSLFSALLPLADAGAGMKNALDEFESHYPSFGGTFRYWLIKYSDFSPKERLNSKFGNRIIYSCHSRSDLVNAITEYISSMTDQFAIKIFGELTRF